jgi:hypothetical protein
VSAGRPLMAPAVVFLAIVVLGACGAPRQTDTEVLVADGVGFRVQIPDGWYAATVDATAWRGGQTLAFISSQPLPPECATDAAGRVCSAPMEVLDRGELLIWWLTARCAGVSCEPPDGERLLVGGRAASQVLGTGHCDELGATAETAYVVAVSPQRLDTIVVCQRDAPASAQAELRDLLDQVDWRTP